MGFLGHNLGSRHARRSIKGSIDADDHLFPKKWLIGLASRASQIGQKSKNTPLCDGTPKEPLTQMK